MPDSKYYEIEASTSEPPKHSSDPLRGYFPAAALGWRMSEEAFLNDVDWLDNLKLRVSYGEVGNDGINSSLWSQNWEATSDKRYQGRDVAFLLLIHLVGISEQGH